MVTRADALHQNPIPAASKMVVKPSVGGLAANAFGAQWAEGGNAVNLELVAVKNGCQTLTPSCRIPENL
jgi:hypothetical protein